MKDIYVAVNKKPIKNFSEITILDYQHHGNSPKIYDVKHMTPLLCANQQREMIMDVVFQVDGQIEVSAETKFCVTHPINVTIPIFVKAKVKSLSANIRFYYNSIN